MLLAAIATLGLQAEVYDKAHQMSGYYATDKRKAHVIIPKAQFAKLGTYSYVDIGFEEQADGSYSVHADGHLPTMIRDPKTNTMVKVEDAVQSAYKRVNGDQAIKTVLTKTIPRLKQLGKIPANATVRKQTVGNTTRVLVSY